MSAEMTETELGPVLFAYDGSDLARDAIRDAGRQLAQGRRAVVLTVWQAFDVGFVAPRKIALNAAAADEVRSLAEQTAAQGADVARAEGFVAEPMVREAAPARRGIIDVADELDASLIVFGSHGRTGLADVFMGSVAQDVAGHSHRPVLIFHRSVQRSD